MQSSGYNQPHNKLVTWVGVGGDDPNYGLIQLGTSMETGMGYRSWFEWVGEGTGVTEQFGNLGAVMYAGTNVVRPGDSVFGMVDWMKDGSDYDMCFDFSDFSRSSGSFSGCQPRVPAPKHPELGKAIKHDTSSMEWIDEMDTSDYPLSFFWQTQFFDQGSIDFDIPGDSDVLDFTTLPYIADIMGDGSPTTVPKPYPPGAPWEGCTSEILVFPLDPVPAPPRSGTGGSSMNQQCNSAIV